MQILAPIIKNTPSSFWYDEETCVSIEQFTEVEFSACSFFSNEHVLLFLFTGIIQISLNQNQEKNLLPEQGLFLAANSSHTMQSSKTCSFIGIAFPTTVLKTLGDKNLSIGDWQSHTILNDRHLLDVMHLLDKEIATRDHHSDSALRHLSQYVGIHTIRNYSTVKTQTTAEPGRPEICQIMCALEYIELNLTTEKSISEVIGQTHLSKHRFLQTFKEVTGQSPQQYIITRRLDVARHMLRRQDLTLDQIAREAGFVDQSHFSKTFRKHFGQSPANFRGQ